MEKLHPCHKVAQFFASFYFSCVSIDYQLVVFKFLRKSCALYSLYAKANALFDKWQVRKIKFLLLWYQKKKFRFIPTITLSEINGIFVQMFDCQLYIKDASRFSAQFRTTICCRLTSICVSSWKRCIVLKKFYTLAAILCLLFVRHFEMYIIMSLLYRRGRLNYVLHADNTETTTKTMPNSELCHNFWMSILGL